MGNKRVVPWLHISFYIWPFVCFARETVLITSKYRWIHPKISGLIGSWWVHDIYIGSPLKHSLSVGKTNVSNTLKVWITSQLKGCVQHCVDSKSKNNIICLKTAALCTLGWVVFTGLCCENWTVLCILAYVAYTGLCCVNWAVLCTLGCVVFTGLCCENWAVLCKLGRCVHWAGLYTLLCCIHLAGLCKPGCVV